MIKTDAMYAELVHKIDQATESGQIDAIKNRLDAIEADIPADASSSNKFSTASDITGITEKIPDTASSSNQLATASDITGITELIPSDASTSNKLATMADIGGGGLIVDTIPITGSDDDEISALIDFISGVDDINTIYMIVIDINVLGKSIYHSDGILSRTEGYMLKPIISTMISIKKFNGQAAVENGFYLNSFNKDEGVIYPTGQPEAFNNYISAIKIYHF